MAPFSSTDCSTALSLRGSSHVHLSDTDCYLFPSSFIDCSLCPLQKDYTYSTQIAPHAPSLTQTASPWPIFLIQTAPPFHTDCLPWPPLLHRLLSMVSPLAQTVSPLSRHSLHAPSLPKCYPWPLLLSQITPCYKLYLSFLHHRNECREDCAYVTVQPQNTLSDMSWWGRVFKLCGHSAEQLKGNSAGEDPLGMGRP